MDPLKNCTECGYEFKSGHDKYKHIIIHNITFEQYIIKNFYENKHPECKCGCRTKLSFVANKSYPFFKEYTKNHFPRKPHTEKTKDLIKKKSKKAIQEKYGVDNVMELKKYRDKIEKTKLKKYGDSKYNNSEKSRENFLKTFFKKITNGERLPDNIIPLFVEKDYNGVTSQYKFQCKTCNTIFEDHLDNGRYPRCLICKPYIKSSEGEKELAAYMRELLPNETILTNNRKIFEGKYELDIFIPSKNIAFEYNGNYWHSDFAGKDSKYHINKLNECEKLNIHLVQIFDDEWINKNDIVKSKIRSILGLSDLRIGARKCKILPISAENKNNFLEKYHIQGKDISEIYLGAFYEDELVSVMTLSSLRLSLGNRSKKASYELVRLASKINVIGICRKFISYIEKNYDYFSIISYADRRWTNKYKNIYLTSGFELISITKPNYWYISQKENCTIRHHRFGFRKSILHKKLDKFDSKLTEYDNMKNNGYCRLYDAGNLKYEIKKP